MLEKVPLLNQDQQSKEKRTVITISISGIYNWWKKRKEKNLKEQTEYWFEDYNPKEKPYDRSEYTCSSNSFASADKINKRIDDAIARANGTGDGEGEKRSCTYNCVGCNRR